MTTIDWASASSNAVAKYDKDLQEAVGEIVLDINDLTENNNVPRRFKLEVVTQLGSALKQLLGGQPVSGSPAPGGGPGSSGPTQKQYDDLETAKKAAEDQNTKLLKDRKVLEEIVLDLGLTAPADSNTSFPSDTATKVKKEIEKKGATGAGKLDTADVKKHVGKLSTAWEARRASRTNKNHSVIENPDAIGAPLEELLKLVP
jgi:hypothetical protein